MTASVTGKALWIIERNLTNELVLADIADSCGVSRFHLAHAFGRRTGQAVMQYVRGRRLSEAAVRLSRGADDILTVALDAGYSSHEAFSRAFRAQFGMTPEALRAARTIDGLALVRPIGAPGGSPALPEPRRTSSGDIRAVGRRSRQRFGTPETIPGQWGAFMAEVHLIPQRIPTIPLAIVTNRDDDGFDYVCAAEVARFDGIPAGMERITVPPATYLVFDHTDHIATLDDTYAAIWDRWLPEHETAASDAPLLERYKPTFDTTSGEGGVEIWVPVAGS